MPVTKEKKAEYSRRYYLKNKEAHKERVRSWRNRNQERYLELKRESSRRNPESNRRRRHERRARERDARVEAVHPHEVYRRGKGICGICLMPVPREDFHVDHIVPLARGGEHSYANTQPAHPICNQRKGAS